ncbi:MAG TPA: 3,4-dihydroxy-2-butanone-4-phosphate synthase [Thiothrix sp.]|nr:3,4-dihydroxy-2-butanone-4-phosphate synthase [Thiothrix sp.]
MKFNTTQELLTDLAAGKMVIVVDDEDRENEGDFLMASAEVTPEHINFMATHGRGLVCMTLMPARCQQLGLSLMVSETNDRHGTNFTISIEAAEGVTTGISAADRATTIQAAIASDASSESIVQPGHIFPIMAQPGGVLTRAGHTEAGCDLARLAGFEPSATIVEILNEDGTMARRDDLMKIAEKHGLKIGTIEDLIRYRVQHEPTVERVQSTVVQTEFGEFNLHVYLDPAKKGVQFALVKGDVQSDQAIMVRVHLENELCDVLSLQEGRCGWPLRDVMRRIAEEGSGVIIVLRQIKDTDDLLRELNSFAENHIPQSTTKTSPKDLKTYGIGAQILNDLGVKKMRVMSAPKRFHGIGGFGLEIVDYVQS